MASWRGGTVGWCRTTSRSRSSPIFGMLASHIDGVLLHLESRPFLNRHLDLGTFFLSITGGEATLRPDLV